MYCPHDENKILNAIALPTSYQASGVSVSSNIEVRSDDLFCLHVIYAGGSGETNNTCEVEVSFSPDGTNWSVYGDWTDGGSGQNTYENQYWNVAQDTNAMIYIGARNLEIPLARWMRVRVKEEGVVTNAGTVTVYLYRNKH